MNNKSYLLIILILLGLIAQVTLDIRHDTRDLLNDVNTLLNKTAGK